MAVLFLTTLVLVYFVVPMFLFVKLATSGKFKGKIKAILLLVFVVGFLLLTYTLFFYLDFQINESLQRTGK